MTGGLPRQLRRLSLVGLGTLLASLLWLTLPLWLAVGMVAGRGVRQRSRPLLAVWLTTFALTLELLSVLVMAGWWLSSGLGLRMQRPYWQALHYDLAQLSVRVLVWQSSWVLGVVVVVEGDRSWINAPRPVLVAARHAGVGDSLLVLHSLMGDYFREPRVVLKSSLAREPVLDVLLHRLSARFIEPAASARPRAEIAEMAAGLEPSAALLIFPEGGTITPERRRRSIDRLLERELPEMAERAERLLHLGAPRPGGLLAALEASPAADVVFVGHAGLDPLTGPRGLLGALPVGRTITMHWWLARRDSIPEEREEQILWLYDWWELIDAWVEATDAEGPASRG